MPVTTRSANRAGTTADSTMSGQKLPKTYPPRAKKNTATKPKPGKELPLEDFHDLASGGGVGYQHFIDYEQDGGSTTVCHKFVAVDADDNIYYGETRNLGASDRLRDMVKKLCPKTAAQVFPVYRASSNLTLAADNLHVSSIFIKRQALIMAMDKQYRYIAHGQFAREIDVMERLARAPHPNIVRYLGCRVRHGRVTGIVLERLASCLGLRSGMAALSQIDDKDVFLGCLESAVAHLHGLGLAHNDINPNNIMIKEDGQPVLIDFGTCCPFGAFTGGQGTTGWTRGDTFAEISDTENDNYALELLRKRIDNPLRLLMYKMASE